MECSSSYFKKKIYVRILISPSRVVVACISFCFHSTKCLEGFVVTWGWSFRVGISSSFHKQVFLGSVPIYGGRTKYIGRVFVHGKPTPPSTTRTSEKTPHRWSSIIKILTLKLVISHALVRKVWHLEGRSRWGLVILCCKHVIEWADWSDSNTIKHTRILQ